MFKTVEELYYSMDQNVRHAVLGKYYYKWSPNDLPEEEKELCASIDEKLEELGYKLVDEGMSGYYNDIQGYMGCEIEEI